MDLESVRKALETESFRLKETSGTKPSAGFEGLMKRVVATTNDLQVNADQAAMDFVEGKEQDIQSVMLAINKAELSFRFMMEVRNKMIEAYQEINRMSV